MSAVVVVRE
jgi:hypothetical protein